MTAAKKIQDQIEDRGFSFGLWTVCPADVPVAWGARAIADQGVGFSLLPDRQTWAGPPELRKAFSKALNSALGRAKEECRRLRDGWKPIPDLGEKAFAEYWHALRRESPELFEDFSASSSSFIFEPPKVYPGFESPKEARPETIFEQCTRELTRVAAYDKEWERKQEAGEEDPPPDPPSRCENEYDEDEEEGEDCGQEFKKVRGQWEGCELDFDAWVCESCGYHHYIEQLEDEEDKPPTTPVNSAYGKIVGYQPARMFSDKSEIFTVFDDHFITIKASTNASYGYVYLIAYPKHTPVALARPASEHPGFENGNGKTLAAPEDVFWSGPMPIPLPGDVVNIERPEIGRATVISYLVEHNYLHLVTVPEGDVPKFWHDQNVGRYVPQALTWNVAGSEIGDDVERNG